MNRVMPFLRYATDDRGTWAAGSGPGAAAGPCACGRSYPRLSAVEGRWTGERLFGRSGEAFSMTALNTHSHVFDRVARFRIRQEQPGEAVLLLVPGPGFDPAEAALVGAEYARRAAGTIRFTVEVVAALPLTGRGKFKFVEQLIPEDAPRGRAEGRNEVA
jgi:phenylacetate-CoA ligase